MPKATPIKGNKTFFPYSCIMLMTSEKLESFLNFQRKAPSSRVFLSLTHLCWCQFLTGFFFFFFYFTRECFTHLFVFVAWSDRSGLVKNHLIWDWPSPSVLPLINLAHQRARNEFAQGWRGRRCGGGTHGANDPSADPVIVNISSELHMPVFHWLKHFSPGYILEKHDWIVLYIF